MLQTISWPLDHEVIPLRTEPLHVSIYWEVQNIVVAPVQVNVHSGLKYSSELVWTGDYKMLSS